MRPLLILSRCSLALIRSVAIELVRISALCIVIFKALSFGNIFAASPSDSELFINGGGSLSAVDAPGGDTDDDETRRIPLEAIRTPCDGDIERFCGDVIVGKLDEADVVDGNGGCKWFGGV